MSEFSKNEKGSEPEIETGKQMDARELFEFLANSGLENWANREDFEKELEPSGLEKEDIALATKFMMCLATVNQLVFQDRVELIFNTSKEKSGNFIQYLPEKEGQSEAYWINVNYFGETIKEILKENRTVFLDENGQLIKNKKKAPPVSFEELLLGIAAHEARHRLQKKRKINMIGLGSKVVCDGEYIDEDLIKLQAGFLKGLRKKKKGEEKWVERQTGHEELDAVIIEKMAVSRLHHKKTSLEQLGQLVTIEPEK